MTDQVDASVLPPPRPLKSPDRGSPLVTAGLIVLAVAFLYLGAGILVPLVLAILLAFALAPLVRRLRRLHLPHIAAVLVAVLIAAAVLSTIGYVVATQMIGLATDLPSYQTTVTEKASSLQHSIGGEFFTQLRDAMAQLQGQLGTGAGGTQASPPMPVTITNNGGGPLDLVQAVLGSILGPLTTAAIVSVFLIFLLLEREDLRDRFLKLVSRGDLRTSTKVMNEAAARVGRYLLVQFGVNFTYGTIFAIGLTVIGVPNAILWGLLAAIFRYIPFVGTLIAASIPFTLAFAVDPGWSMLAWAVALFVTLELVTTNAIEPRLYGSSTGLSPLAVLIAAMFWATLWGPIGLILSTPVTVCLVVIGRYVPQLAFFETLLGSEPVLSTQERFYQRLVAGNTEEAIEVAEDYIDTHDTGDFYAGVALPSLRLAEADLSIEAADLSHRRNIVASMAAVINEIEDDKPAAPDAAAPRILSIGGRTEIDGLAALMVGRMLQDAGHPTRVLAPITVRQESIGQLPIDDVDVICLSYLGDNPRSYVRFVARRLKRRKPSLQIVACLFNTTGTPAQDTAQDWQVDAIAKTLAEAVKVTVAHAGSVKPDTVSQPPVLSGDTVSPLKLRQLAQSDGPLAQSLADLAAAMRMPVAVIDVAPDAESGLPITATGGNLVAQHVMDTRKLLVIPDVAKDGKFANDTFLLENGIAFYAGVPLVRANGTVIGALSLLDHAPRVLDTEQLDRLELFALKLMVELSTQMSARPGTLNAQELVQPPKAS